MRRETVLTPSEIEIIKQSRRDPNVFTEYFFRTDHTPGFIFDYKFMPEGAWQKKLHFAKQKDITVIGGFGTGKTVGVGMSATTWAATTTDFKFLNVAPKAWQAKLMYDSIIEAARDTRFEDMIWEKPRKPYPKIIIRYRVGNSIFESSLEFMSADKNAQGILSWEGDWLHVDESGLLDNLEEVIINAGSRLRGTVRGRTRLGRFSMTSNSWDNYQLWYYFDLAAGDPENFLSIVVSSRHNGNVTPEQLSRMLARIPKDERDRFIEGFRPEGRGRFFDKESVYACEDPLIGEIVEEKAEKKQKGYVFESLYGCGVVDYREPPNPKAMYMFLGDPGIDGAPKRNSPVWMGWDVTKFPAVPARLVYFWWGNGGGRIYPFFERMLDFMEYYKPIITGIDSTGPQRNMADLVNEYLIQERFASDDPDSEDYLRPGIDTPLGRIYNIKGLDFSGSKKSGYLQAARLLVESKLLSWPKAIVGIRSQLTNYDPEADRGANAKIAQDIVASLSMSAHAIRSYFHVSPQELYEKANLLDDQKPEKVRRLPGRARTRRTPRKNPLIYRPSYAEITEQDAWRRN